MSSGKLNGWDLNGEKIACNLSVGLNSGHPLFIGEGRTGESPILHTTSKQGL